MIVLLNSRGHIPPSRKQGNCHMAWNPLGYILENQNKLHGTLQPAGPVGESASAIFGKGMCARTHWRD